MTTTETSLTLRSDRGSVDATVDVEARQHGLTVSGSGTGFVSIPGRFKILSQIGIGGMGIVYKVRDLETDEIVALKVLKPEIASDPRMREELRKEVCLARKVTHKNVCRIHEFHRSDAASCISMEFVHGETLLSKLRRVGVLPVQDSIDTARQICAGLREAHARGIVHRDLKPANIMIDQSGVVKIMDFGIARLSQENNQVTRTIVGTPEYMAPEQLELKTMGPRTDIYSLGLLLYEMVTGTQAFTGDSSIAVALKQIRESPRRPSEIVSTLSPALEAVILKCLRKNRDSRFQSIDQLDSALCKAAANVARDPIVAQMKMDSVVKFATGKWQVLLPQLVRFGLELNRAANNLIQWVHDESQRLARPVIARYGSHPRKKQQIQLAAIATVAILGVVVLVLKSAKHGDRETIAPAVIVSPSLQNTDAAASSPMLSPPSAVLIDSHEQTGGASQQEADLDLVAERNSDVPATPSSSAVTPPHSVPQSDAPNAEPLKKRTRIRPISAPVPPKSKPNVTNVDSAVPQTHPVPADQMLRVSSTSATPAAVVVAQPAASATVNADTTKPIGDKPASIPETYLEVGSFGDTKWADGAVERLSQLGFHAICVHKTLLWKQSYHVQVGPYVTSEQIDDAQKRLTDQGFKSRVVK